MNWKQVVIYVVFVLLATFIASFPFGVIEGVLSAQQRPAPSWVRLGPAVAVPVAAAVVFYLLARRQRDRPWQHALVVAILAWLVSFPINVIGLGQPLTVWGFGIIVILVALAAGVGVASSRGNTRRESTPAA